MSDKSIFEKRESQFEAEYFNRKNAEQIDQLKAVFRKKMDKESISKATGVTDDKTLDRMVELQLNGELMSAFQLYPLVEIAWADGKLDDSERAAVMAAAEKRGVAPGTKAHQYLGERLSLGPSKDIRAIWMLYAKELKSTLSSTNLETFRHDIFNLCKEVAEASGGFLGKTFSVSGDERKIMEAIDLALSG